MHKYGCSAVFCSRLGLAQLNVTHDIANLLLVYDTKSTVTQDIFGI